VPVTEPSSTLRLAPTAGRPVLFVPTSPDELNQAREVLREYALSLKFDLCFQQFDDELAQLPGEYAAPRGTLLLVRVGQEMAGCCGMRPLDTVDYANACEMKRLYVKPAFRSLGLGRLLAEAVMESARLAGYDSILLDTLDDMEAARALYVELGFEEVPPYYHNPIAGAHYLRAVL